MVVDIVSVILVPEICERDIMYLCAWCTTHILKAKIQILLRMSLSVRHQELLIEALPFILFIVYLVYWFLHGGYHWTVFRYNLLVLVSSSLKPLRSLLVLSCKLSWKKGRVKKQTGWGWHKTHFYVMCSIMFHPLSTLLVIIRTDQYHIYYIIIIL